MMKETFSQAIIAIRAGQKKEAQRLLVKIVKNDPRHAQAWYALSFVVDKREQQIDCLQRTLKYASNHSDAKSRLKRLISLATEDGDVTTTKILHEIEDALPVSENKAMKGTTLLASDPLLGKGTTQITTTESSTYQARFQIDYFQLVELGLSRRVYNALYRGGIKKIAQLASLSEEDLLKINNIGEVALVEISSRLKEYKAKFSLAGPDAKVITKEQQEIREKQIVELPAQVGEKSVELLNLTARSKNVLMRNDICTIQKLVSLSNDELLELKNAGTKIVTEIQAQLTSFLAENKIEMESLLQESTLLDNDTDPGNFSLSPILVASLADIPIEAISIKRLGLNEFTKRKLERQKIKTIYDLVQYHKEFVKEGETGRSLGRYLEWLVNQNESVWLNEVEGRGISPLLKLELAKTTCESLLAQWLEQLSNRDKKILLWRYGISSDPLTLQEIGEKLAITRERVRQIEKKVLRKLKNRYGWAKQNLLHAILNFLSYSLEEQGGLLSEQEIKVLFAEEVAFTIGNVNLVAFLALICEVDGRFRHFKRQKFFALTHHPIDLIIDVQAKFSDLVKEKAAPTSEERLLNELKKTSLFNEVDNVDDKFLLACLRVHPSIEKLDSGYANISSSSKRLGAIITALREIGEPAHFSVIAEKTNELLPPDQQFTVRDVHSWLGRYSDIFVWVRLRGTYGLKEWGLERELSYVDACAQILENVGHPLSFDQIVARMPEMRQYFDESSIMITLGTHERFYSFSNNRYGLVEWSKTQSKTNFADLFGAQLARLQAELDHQNKNVEIDTQKEVDTIRNIGLDFFSD